MGLKNARFGLDLFSNVQGTRHIVQRRFQLSLGQQQLAQIDQAGAHRLLVSKFLAQLQRAQMMGPSLFEITHFLQRDPEIVQRPGLTKITLGTAEKFQRPTVHLKRLIKFAPSLVHHAQPGNRPGPADVKIHLIKNRQSFAVILQCPRVVPHLMVGAADAVQEPTFVALVAGATVSLERRKGTGEGLLVFAHTQVHRCQRTQHHAAPVVVIQGIHQALGFQQGGHGGFVIRAQVFAEPQMIETEADAFFVFQAAGHLQRLTADRGGPRRIDHENRAGQFDQQIRPALTIGLG